MGYRIAHVGAFDFENFGDLLFTDVLKAHLEKRITVNEIIYFAPKACKMPNKEVWVHAVTELENFVKDKKIDAIIIGGGDLVHLRKIRTYMPHVSEDGWVTYDVLYMWVIPSLIALKYEIPLAWNAPGVPLHFSKTDKEIVSYLCQTVKYISVRDEEAKNELKQAVAENKIHVVPDSVLSIKNIFKTKQLDEIFDNLNVAVVRKHFVFVQFNITTTESDFEHYAVSLNKIRQETGWDVLIQPIGYACGDLDAIDKFMALYGEDFISPPQHYDQYEILALIANSALYIGTSLHGAIVANSYNVPNIVVNTSHFNKIEGFVKMLNREAARIFYPVDIFTAYRVAREIDSSAVVEEKIRDIEKHFDRLVEEISDGEQQRIPLVNGLADYIFDASFEIEAISTVVKRLENEKEKCLEEIGALQAEKEYYKMAYHTAINSTSWKVTEPLRKLSNIVRGRKNQ